MSETKYEQDLATDLQNLHTCLTDEIATAFIPPRKEYSNFADERNDLFTLASIAASIALPGSDLAQVASNLANMNVTHDFLSQGADIARGIASGTLPSSGEILNVTTNGLYVAAAAVALTTGANIATEILTHVSTDGGALCNIEEMVAPNAQSQTRQMADQRCQKINELKSNINALGLTDDQKVGLIVKLQQEMTEETNISFFRKKILLAGLIMSTSASVINDRGVCLKPVRIENDIDIEANTILCMAIESKKYETRSIRDMPLLNPDFARAPQISNNPYLVEKSGKERAMQFLRRTRQLSYVLGPIPLTIPGMALPILAAAGLLSASLEARDLITGGTQKVRDSFIKDLCNELRACVQKIFGLGVAIFKKNGIISSST